MEHIKRPRHRHVNICVAIGDMLAVENHTWLHERNTNTSYSDSLRVLMRQHG